MKSKPIHVENFADLSVGMVFPDFSFDLCLPDGKHVRGQSGDLDKAKLALVTAHNGFVLSAWERGEYDGRGRWVVQLC